jgi:hypothetical protein
MMTKPDMPRAVLLAASLLASTVAAAEPVSIKDTGTLPERFAHTNPFGSVACRDPRDTLTWLWLLSGDYYERTVRDGERVIELHGTRTQVLLDVQSWIRSRFDQCILMSPGDDAFVVTRQTRHGRAMACLRKDDTCYWTAVELIGPPRPPP